MKVLVIQPKIGMGDMIIYLPYIHAISKKYENRCMFSKYFKFVPKVSFQNCP